MKFSVKGQEKGDLLIQVTAWAGLTVYAIDKRIQLFKRELYNRQNSIFNYKLLIWCIIA
jgi:hypothetical protein